MKGLYDELLTRFPEISSRIQEGDEELPYLIMGDLVDWLDSKGENGIDENTIRRLVEFADWCKLQPRGETCSDDICTISVVAFYENLFLHEHTKWLIPRLTSKEVVEQDKDYLVAWVGQENYEKVIEQFQREQRL